MGDAGTFYVHKVYFPAIWHILWPFGIFFPVLVHFTRFSCCTKKNLATLAETKNCTRAPFSETGANLRYG
jgi:hypothetical protein